MENTSASDPSFPLPDLKIELVTPKKIKILFTNGEFASMTAKQIREYVRPLVEKMIKIQFPSVYTDSEKGAILLMRSGDYS